MKLLTELKGKGTLMVKPMALILTVQTLSLKDMPAFAVTINPSVFFSWLPWWLSW